ncbi:MAG: hypothetical protein CO170_02510 [candidate division SR1 bacterium CG_4_9_14_3_um_filter_40_9]|nr:MAG: hypothetical protein CO170_02510 [candidate division SR1 bacterium CG_4_9_14_3_um_filter_40_9]
MPKPTKNATLFCIIASILAIVGILLGRKFDSVLISMFFLLPTIVYEIYRTEGDSTKYASRGLLVVFVAEIILIIFNVKFDLIQFFQTNTKYIQGYEIPLGDIKVVGPILMAVLSLLLVGRTRGVYTRWLAVIIIVTSLFIIYVLDPASFSKFIKIAIDQVMLMAGMN